MKHTICWSSSSPSVLQLRQSLGFLNNSFPFKVIWDLFCPFYMLHPFQVIPDIISPSGLVPSYWSSCKWFPFVYFLHDTDFRHSIYVSKPTRSLSFNVIYYVPVFYWFIQLLVCFNPPNTLIFFSWSRHHYLLQLVQTLLSSLVGPNTIIFFSWSKHHYLLQLVQTPLSSLVDPNIIVFFSWSKHHYLLQLVQTPLSSLVGPNTIIFFVGPNTIIFFSWSKHHYLLQLVQTPLSSLVGPNTFLIIYLSETQSLYNTFFQDPCFTTID